MQNVQHRVRSTRPIRPSELTESALALSSQASRQPRRARSATTGSKDRQQDARDEAEERRAREHARDGRHVSACRRGDPGEGSQTARASANGLPSAHDGAGQTRRWRTSGSSSLSLIALVFLALPAASLGPEGIGSESTKRIKIKLCCGTNDKLRSSGLASARRDLASDSCG